MDIIIILAVVVAIISCVVCGIKLFEFFRIIKSIEKSIDKIKGNQNDR